MILARLGLVENMERPALACIMQAFGAAEWFRRLSRVTILR